MISIKLSTLVGIKIPKISTVVNFKMSTIKLVNHNSNQNLPISVTTQPLQGGA